MLRPAVACAAGLSLLLLTGCSLQAAATTRTPKPSVQTVPPTHAPDVPRTDIGIGEANPAQTVAPTRISFPSLSIDMPVTPVGVDSTGGVAIPSDSDIAGWYKYGPGLFTSAGSIVLVSHIDSWNGVGPFSRIKDAAPGATITLTGGPLTRTFAVSSVQQNPKAGGSITSFFTKDGPPRLVLVTCGGAYNSAIGHYVDNIVLLANPTS